MKTFRDWMWQATRRARKKPDQAAQCLREAEPLARDAGDWAELAEVWAATGAGGHDDARRCADRAVTDGGDDVSPYRRVANVYARAVGPESWKCGLGDRDAARRILDGYLAICEARADTSLGDWRWIGSAYIQVLDDRDVARTCLERGVAGAAAPSVGDLCTLAGGYRELGDPATVRALIERAAATVEAGADEGDAWSVANQQRHALSDLDAAWHTLERGLERATTIAGCLRMAHAAASHAQADLPRPPVLRAAITKAESLATTAIGWIEVADAWHEHRFGAADIARALERAQACDPDEAARTRIAHGYRHWLGDAATADRIAARGVAPAALVARHQRLDGWDADPAGLLDWLRPQLTAKSLREIASADWGSDADKHVAVLQDILVTGLIPQPLEWHPREVLELVRWREGEKVDHVARAFACAVLLVDALGATYRDGHEQTMAVLIESCLVLGDEAMARAVGLLVAATEGYEAYYTEHLFACLGVLMAAAARDPHDGRLPALAERIVADELEHQRHPYDRPQWGWLLGHTSFDLRNTLWRRLSEQLLAEPARADPSLAHLADLADRLRGTA